MLTPEQLKQRWVSSTPNPFRQFETHELEILNLPSSDREFLREAGLPVFATRYIYFGDDFARIEGTPYIQIGSCGDDRPICVDTSGSGTLVSLGKADSKRVDWFSRSIPVLCEILLAHQQMVKEALWLNGRRAWFDNDIPDFLVHRFHARLREMDPQAADTPDSYWSEHVQWLLSHAVEPQPMFDEELKKRISPSMGELEFIDLIDANFYFETLEDFENAVRVGCRISEMAALCVGEELVRGFPKGHVPFRLRLLKLLKEELPTPLILAAHPVMEALIIDTPADTAALSGLVEAVRAEGGGAASVAIEFVLLADPSFEDEYDRIRQEFQWQPDE